VSESRELRAILRRILINFTPHPKGHAQTERNEKKKKIFFHHKRGLLSVWAFALCAMMSADVGKPETAVANDVEQILGSTKQATRTQSCAACSAHLKYAH
jgi:hypothetical protein